MPPYAPACACATRVLTRAERVWVRVRANTTLLAGCQGLAGRGVWRGYNKRFNGPRTGFCVWPMHWPRRGLLRALAGLLGALLGLCAARAMLGKLGAGLRYLFSLYIRTVLDAYTVHRRMA